MSESEAEPTPEPPSREELKKAMKAFRKRLKVTRLDDESRLGYGPMSGGGKSSVIAITPPNQYSRAVWDELVKQGRLRYLGQGIFELADE
ncbi:MAG: hypothetical protein O3B13_11665 [Planctomycetota bacterium]|nr:hypothetical protein [Planctomycetota bacterium]MDA1163750.1 hypothetical protein [Planctomycetota bacterium]